MSSKHNKTFDRDVLSAYAVDEQPALQIRLNQDLGPLPAGLALQLPKDIALALLRTKGLATPVGDLSTWADISLDDDQLAEIGFDVHSLTPAIA